MRALVVVTALAGAPAFADVVTPKTPLSWSSPTPTCSGGAHPATVEYTAWLGVGAAQVRSDDQPNQFVMGLRAGAAFDFDLAQYTNPWHYGGKFDLRWGPWFDVEGRSNKSASLHGGLSLDFGQVRHASFGTYTLRFGGGVDDDRRPEATFVFLGGVRYVPERSRYGGPRCGPRTAFASGVRMFGQVTTDFDGRTIWTVGVELEPSWAFPPYSLHKLGGVND
jgi:opacity protein-like surface antigen